MAKKRKVRTARKSVSSGIKVTEGLAIAALILNLILPGLGTIIAGRKEIGLWQFIPFLVAMLLNLTVLGVIIGIPLWIAMWIWALVTSIDIVRKASK